MKPRQLVTFVLWATILILSGYFYFENAVAYLFGYRNERFGDTFFHNQFWFVAHIIGANSSLVLGPIQFWKNIRTRYLRYHRIAGNIYIIGSLWQELLPFAFLCLMMVWVADNTMDFVFGAIENTDTRGVVNEWIFSFMPLFGVEIVMIWLPTLYPKRN